MGSSCDLHPMSNFIEELNMNGVCGGCKLEVEKKKINFHSVARSIDQSAQP